MRRIFLLLLLTGCRLNEDDIHRLADMKCQEQFEIRKALETLVNQGNPASAVVLPPNCVAISAGPRVAGDHFVAMIECSADAPTPVLVPMIYKTTEKPK